MKYSGNYFLKHVHKYDEVKKLMPQCGRFFEGWRYAINDPREGGGNTALCGTSVRWKTCTHL